MASVGLLMGCWWGGGMCVLRWGQYRCVGDSVKIRKRMVKYFDREYFADYMVMKITIRSFSNYFAYYMVVRITIDLLVIIVFWLIGCANV